MKIDLKIKEFRNLFHELFFFVSVSVSVSVLRFRSPSPSSVIVRSGSAVGLSAISLLASFAKDAAPIPNAAGAAEQGGSLL